MTEYSFALATFAGIESQEGRIYLWVLVLEPTIAMPRID